MVGDRKSKTRPIFFICVPDMYFTANDFGAFLLQAVRKLPPPLLLLLLLLLLLRSIFFGRPAVFCFLNPTKQTSHTLTEVFFIIRLSKGHLGSGPFFSARCKLENRICS